jgi:uncharacterized protein (UPF0305 family)
MDGIMKQNIKLLNDSKFDKDYYRNKYVEAINKIATMTGKMVDLQQQLLDSGKKDAELIENKCHLKNAHWKINYLEQQLTLTQKSHLDKTDNKDNE